MSDGIAIVAFFCAKTILWPILSVLIIFVADYMHLGFKFLSFNCMCGNFFLVLDRGVSI